MWGREGGLPAVAREEDATCARSGEGGRLSASDRDWTCRRGTGCIRGTIEVQ